MERPTRPAIPKKFLSMDDQTLRPRFTWSGTLEPAAGCQKYIDWMAAIASHQDHPINCLTQLLERCLHKGIHPVFSVWLFVSVTILESSLKGKLKRVCQCQISLALRLLAANQIEVAELYTKLKFFLSALMCPHCDTWFHVSLSILITLFKEIMPFLEVNHNQYRSWKECWCR